MSQRLVIGLYLALLLLQVVWHFLLPQPFGAHNWILAVVASLPLLLPLAGIAKGRFRSMTWGGFLAVLYFVIGVMEAWSNPAQRIPATIQIVLALGYCGALTHYSRQGSKKYSQAET
jgi:uncharacterized membrane protein